jgi:hypothetical protein
MSLPLVKISAHLVDIWRRDLNFLSGQDFWNTLYITYDIYLYRKEKDRALSIVKNNRERIRTKEEGTAHAHIIERVILLPSHSPLVQMLENKDNSCRCSSWQRAQKQWQNFLVKWKENAYVAVFYITPFFLRRLFVSYYKQISSPGWTSIKSCYWHNRTWWQIIYLVVQQLRYKLSLITAAH